MQNLEVISVNFWQILISLCNLLILFLLVKKFLYKPVKKAFAARQETMNAQYAKAENAEKEADKLRTDWKEKMAGADQKADEVIKNAEKTAENRKAAILDEAQQKAERILRQAETDADLERKKAKAGIKQEIVDVSTALSEKMLGREINAEDHRHMIDTFLSEIGDDDEGNK